MTKYCRFLAKKSFESDFNACKKSIVTFMIYHNMGIKPTKLYRTTHEMLILAELTSMKGSDKHAHPPGLVRALLLAYLKYGSY